MLEAVVNAPPRDLKSEDFSAKLDTLPMAADRILTKVVFSATLRVSVPLGLWAESQLGVITSEAVDTVV